MSNTEFGLSCLNTALPWQVITQDAVESTVKFTIFSHTSLFYSENTIFFQLTFLANCASIWRVNRGVHGDQPPHTSPGHRHKPGTSTGHGHPPGTSRGHGHPARMGPSSWDVGTRGAQTPVLSCLTSHQKRSLALLPFVLPL